MSGKHEGAVKPAAGELAVALAYVPAARRPAVAALFALDARLKGIVAGAREPMIGRIRLAWWRDALAALDERPPPAEPLLAALADAVRPIVTGAEMAAMVAGWDALLPLDAVDEAALDSHARERGERLFALGGRLLGGRALGGRASGGRLPDGRARDEVPPAGAGGRWARADLARTILPGAAPPPPARHDRWPGALRPLGMLAVLAARDPAEREGSPARLLAMLRHRLTGR